METPETTTTSFFDKMAALRLAQVIKSPTHENGHMLDLMFCKGIENFEHNVVDKMEEKVVRNETRVTQFILLGLSSDPDLQILFFVMLLMIYLLTAVGNLLILVTIYVDPQLHTPMYFFLSNLSFLDLGFSSVAVPKSLVNFVFQSQTISFSDCIAQVFFIHFFGGSESLHLVLMAYDRYVAICNPLRYTTIMNRRACLLLVVSTWVGGLMHGFGQTFPAVQLPFCGPNVINHFFCDTHALTLLACSRTFFSETADIINSGILALSSFVVLFVSYTYIISTILKIRSAEGRQKAFSTCASHLLVVTLYFGPLVFIYMRPSVTFAGDKLISGFYTIITPVLNPFIYTLRNEKVIKSIKRLRGRKASFLGTHIN
ncbi:olfactory receptor 4E2-like [Microcaecilia unicolor]|uniref:Olfactory receptor n=1 Tax=Microcaecilia unicolor TaxID=1415580 RepID=A0A6P7WH03_9AMPH|nr:olfactory receptor 4E2-like [Microcaecilia unicolor]